MSKTKKLLMGIGLSLATGLTLSSCNLDDLIDLIPTEQPSTSNPDISEDTDHDHDGETGDIHENVMYDDFQIHSLELGNDYAGDSTYIKVGDIDILIDAGSRKGSAPTIKNYLDQYVTDGKLEYVIATHAHQDHIAAFVGSKSGNTRTGILYQYEVGTLIDFDLTNATSALYGEYLDAREYVESKGTKHYTAGQCFNNENGASQTIQLSDKVTMQILYNKYYYETSSDENNYSVVTLFTYEDGEVSRNFFLSGDLEKEGEEELVKYYSRPDTPTLPHVDYYKAGHHGSKTSSNADLLEMLQPEIVTVCCCAGSTEYTKNLDNTFPTQDMIDRISLYTDRVYVTSLFDEKLDTFTSMNGNIVVSTSGNKIGLYTTNNLTKLKDTEWFNEIIWVVDVKGEAQASKEGVSGAYQRARRIMPEAWK